VHSHEELNSARILTRLEEAILSQSASDVESALTLLYQTKAMNGAASVLIKLLALPWHRKHEDIARLLQQLRDPTAVEALYAAALEKHGYLAYDNSYALARKCTWALGDIGTPEAFAKLKLLATHRDSVIAQYAQERIDRWEHESHRKPR
jgi:hypothetical protein